MPTDTTPAGAAPAKPLKVMPFTAADDTAVAAVVPLFAPSATLFETEALAPAPSAVEAKPDAVLFSPMAVP